MRKMHIVPARGERVAKFVEDYLKDHPGLSAGELASKLQVDKRDLQRLLTLRSCGWRLEDQLAAYFGLLFVDALFAPIVGEGPSFRELELERERAALCASRRRIERDREAIRARGPRAGAGFAREQMAV